MLYKNFIVSLLLANFLVTSGCSGESSTCKVENTGGAPRISVDGKPVRARMLYVSPTYFMLGTPTKRKAYKYMNSWVDTFVEIPKLSRPLKKGEIRIDGPLGPLEYRISDLHIVDSETGEKVYNFDIKNRDSRVYVISEGKSSFSFSKAPDGTDFLKVESLSNKKSSIIFKGVNLDAGKIYKINIKIRGNKNFDFDMYICENGKFLEPKIRSYVGPQVKLAKDAGVDMVTFPIQAADFMPEDGKSYNFKNLTGALDEILKANPNAKILLRIRFYPPKWWLEKYPDDVITSSEGIKSSFPCVSSERFRNDAANVLKMIIDFCEKNYGKNIIGYHPGGGGSCEWYYPTTWDKYWYGFNKTASDAWKKWVLKKYETDENLRKAWNDESLTIAGVEVPSGEERSQAGYILDPIKQAKIIDYNAFLQDEMVDMVEHLGKVIREKVPNKLSVLFYGYTCEFSGARIKGPSNTGHYGLLRVVNSPYFDIITGPVSYTDRDIGDAGFSMGAVETIARHGKMWIEEEDIRTHRTPQTQQKVTALGRELRNVTDTISVLQRDLARQILRNQGSWWMDLAGTGWYYDPELWKLIPKFAAMEKDMIENLVPYEPEVAVVADERSIYYSGVNGTAATTTNSLMRSRSILGKCPLPIGYYLFDDFIYGKPKLNPKLAVFSIEFALNAKQRKAMRRKAKDCAAIFVWIPGYIDLNKNAFSISAVKEATGFEVDLVNDCIKAVLVPTDEGKKIGLTKVFGFKDTVAPLLSPKLEDGDVVLAQYENGMPAVVLRDKHLFCGVADIPFGLYWHMIKISGAHMYAQEPLSVYANGAYVSVTALGEDKTVRPIEIDLKTDKEIFDALSGEKLGNGPKIILNMKRGDNRVLRIGNGNADFIK